MYGTHAAIDQYAVDVQTSRREWVEVECINEMCEDFEITHSLRAGVYMGQTFVDDIECPGCGHERIITS